MKINANKKPQPVAVQAGLPAPNVISINVSDEPWLTREQVAERLQLTPNQIYQLTRRRCRNPLPCYKAGIYQRFRWSEVEAWMIQNKAA